MTKKNKSSVKGLTSQPKNGQDLWKFQYTKDGKQMKIYIGLVSQKDAEYDALFLQRLVEYMRHPQPIDKQTLSWIDEKTPEFRKKLFNHGLIKKQEEIEEESAITLRQLCDIWQKRYEVVVNDDGTKTGNENTYKNVKLSADKLRNYFGDKKYSEISEDDVETFEKTLRAKYEVPTVVRHVKRFRQVAKWGIERKLISSPNIFMKMKLGKQSNPQRVKTISKDLFQ